MFNPYDVPAKKIRVPGPRRTKVPIFLRDIDPESATAEAVRDDIAKSLFLQKAAENGDDILIGYRIKARIANISPESGKW